jgi:hypothetical protein
MTELEELRAYVANVKTQQKKYYNKHRDGFLKNQKKYYDKNKDKILEKKKEYYNKKKQKEEEPDSSIIVLKIKSSNLLTL